MTRLDQHIRSVRNKLSMALFIDAWATALLVLTVVLLLYAIVRQSTAWMVPREPIALSILVLLSIAYAAWRTSQRWPDELAAAVAIDERLGLNEKFSTALHARRSDDPFSKATIQDAEATAGQVDLHRKFPLHWPRELWAVLIVALLSAALLGFIRPRNVFASNAPGVPSTDALADARQQAKDNVNKAIAAIDQAPKLVSQKAPLQLAKAELQDLLKKPDIDPAGANRKALSAMQQLQQIAQQQQKDDPAAAEARRTEQQMAAMKPDAKDAGAVADAHRDLSQGKFESAADKLGDAVKNFDKMSPTEKAAAAKQMQQMADRLQKAANDPQQQERLQQQMQQLGMTPQQQQQAQQLMKQAAQGDTKSAQQLQQLAKQSVHQLNKGQPATPQQQQQAEQAAKQMQAQAQSQQQKQQLQQDTQKIAQAMQQQSGSPSSTPPSDSGQKNGPQKSGDTSKADQQQQSQDMQKAMADAQQQLQKMQAQSQDAKQTAQAGQNAQQAAADAQQSMNGNQPGQGQPEPGKPGQSQGSPSNQQIASGQPAPNVGTGHGQTLGTPPKSTVDATVTKAVSDSDDTDPDHVLASSLVKSDSPRGESHAPLQNVAKSTAQQAADEIDSEHVGREGQKVVRDYFGTLGDGK